MAVDVLLGLQWGDEGKGKIVDVIAPHYHWVARFQGGPNAGHTLEFDGHKHVLHQIPSGIFRPEIKNLIGNGVVLDAIVFKKEIDGLAPYNIDFSRNLFISKKAQLILPTHRLLDAAYEKAKGESKIGSTLRGIGPTYTDKVSRHGLRVGDVLSPDFNKKLLDSIAAHKAILDYHKAEYDLDEAISQFLVAVDFLRTFNLVDGEYLLNEALTQGKNVLAEGAQGSMLDIDFGSYPFVTSSTTMVAGACTGLGVAPRSIRQVYGIFKAYCTRVGSGPFPTELNDETGEAIRKKGNEFGSTTGRPRRTGWLDLPALKYACMINGVTKLLMMKADVLNGMPELEICTDYQHENGQKNNMLPYDLCAQNVKPIYTTMKGWPECEPSGGMDELPQGLTDYIRFIEHYLGIPVELVSMGPDRKQTIMSPNLLLAV